MTAKAYTGTISQSTMADFATKAADVNTRLVAVENATSSSSTNIQTLVAALHTSLHTIGTAAETALGQDAGTFAPTGGGNKGQ